jgi:excisionase family DNA binding protein
MKEFVLDLRKLLSKKESNKKLLSKKESNKKYLTVKEVAKIFGVTPLTVRNWDKSGKLKALRHPINNYRIYKIEDVENFLKKLNRKKIEIKEL